MTYETYNDVKTNCGETIAEITYALTNEKGKNRKERANRHYYSAIRQTPLATFVKVCDRLANAKYSKDSGSSMLNAYKKENEYFCSELFTLPLAPMFDELNSILSLKEPVQA